MARVGTSQPRPLESHSESADASGRQPPAPRPARAVEWAGGTHEASRTDPDRCVRLATACPGRSPTLLVATGRAESRVCADIQRDRQADQECEPGSRRGFADRTTCYGILAKPGSCDA